MDTSILDEKENIGNSGGSNSKHVINKLATHSRTIKDTTSAFNSAKFSKQEYRLIRFIEWKEKKKQMETLKREQSQKEKPPFVPVGRANSLPKTAMCYQSSTNAITTPEEHRQPKNRKSIYEIAPTPPRKNSEVAVDSKKLPKAAIDPLNVGVSTGAFGKAKALRSKRLATNTPEESSNQKVKPNLTMCMKAKRLTALTGKQRPPRKMTETTIGVKLLSSPRAAQNNMSLNDREPQKTKVQKSIYRIVPTPERKPLEVAIDGNQFPKATSNVSTGAIGKAKGLLRKRLAAKISEVSSNQKISLNSQQPKRGETTKLTSKTELKGCKTANVKMSQSKGIQVSHVFRNRRIVNPVVGCNASKAIMGPPPSSSKIKSNLSVSMKAKHSSGRLTAKHAPTSIILNKKNMLNICSKHTAVAETPTCFENLNFFDEFVTSTRIKSDVTSNFTLDGVVSPFGKKTNTRLKRTAKRILELSQQKLTTDENATDEPHNQEIHKSDQYDTDSIPVAREKLDDAVNETIYKTPPRENSQDQPSNYLSPFVSVSRGKVSARREKDKRNSMYLQETSTTSIEVRRTLETVKYFRKSLNDEIDRLHRHCDEWECYKLENAEYMQTTGGEDMIDVAIGQTRLLTSKKFMQFKGLIDRCEIGATGIGALSNDGSEDTKPVNSEDLEGFWSMLGIQVDNVDQRFANLNRWKKNNWIDPDINIIQKKIKKVKPKTNLAPKIVASSMLQTLMRQMRRNKAVSATRDPDNAALTPMGKSCFKGGTPQSNSASRRLVVVLDRKSRSGVPTVVSVPTPMRKKSSVKQPPETLSIESPKLKLTDAVNEFQRSLKRFEEATNINVGLSGRKRKQLLKPALFTDTERRLSTVGASILKFAETDETKCSPCSPTPKARKSILKTPGTAKNKSKNVIFNEKLKIKKFKFTVQSDEEDEKVDNNSEEISDVEENADQRIYRLRNRKVKQRPSCEIVIPS